MMNSLHTLLIAFVFLFLLCFRDSILPDRGQISELTAYCNLPD
jgi:hypothetical protein